MRKFFKEIGCTSMLLLIGLHPRMEVKKSENIELTFVEMSMICYY